MTITCCFSSSREIKETPRAGWRLPPRTNTALISSHCSPHHSPRLPWEEEVWARVQEGLCEFTLLESGNWQRYYEICHILNAPRSAGGASLCGRLINLINKDMVLWFP